jgi:hypothetical protein
LRYFQNKLIIIFTILILFTTEEIQAFDHGHASYQMVLDQYLVKKGPQTLINYSNLKKSPAELDNYLSQLSSLTHSEFSKWSKDQQLATLINAYNAWTLKIIIKNYPLKSIKDIGSLFSTAWNSKFFIWLGKETSLDEIEHKQIRGGFKEPRIHFALVCASISCPTLAPKVFVAEKLDSQLEEASLQFLTDKNKNKISSEKPLRLQISSIFKWYGEDFTNLDQFLAERMTTDSSLKAKIQKGQYKKEYLDYNWNLNDTKELN